MSNEVILLVEDEENLRNSLSFILEGKGHRVEAVGTGEEGVEVARRVRPGLALIDIGLPGMDGFQVAAELSGLRKETGLIIVFLTGSDDEDDIVRALTGLADDYIVKPVRPRVLMARLALLLSRREKADTKETQVECGPIRIRASRYEAELDGVPMSLTRTEFQLLLLLAGRPGRAFTRSEIITEVHGEDCHLTDRSVDFQVHSLRKKLAKHADLLVTVRGVGFKLLDA